MITYGQQKTMVGRTVGKLVKSRAMRFVGMAMGFGRAVRKWYLKHISELGYFSEHLRWNWIGRSDKSFRSAIYIGDEERVVSLHRFSMVGVGSYKRSPTS